MIYVAYRYGSRCEYIGLTVEEAVRRAADDHESGEAAFYCILNDDGSEFMNRHELRKRVFAYHDSERHQ